LSYIPYYYSGGCGPGAYFNQTTYTNFGFTIGGTTYPISGQQVVAQGYGSVSCPNYTQPSVLPITLPNTNNSTVPAGECVFNFSNGTGQSSCPSLVTNTIDPLYKVVSILYEPPGNESTQGLATQVGGIGAAMKNQQTWTWQDFQSTAMSTGASNSVQILLKTTTANCFASVALYEDTLYHTFAFQFPTGAPGCN